MADHVRGGDGEFNAWQANFVSPDIEEDLSTQGLFAGALAPRPSETAR